MLPAPTHIDKLPPVVLDADPGLLDHVQVGAGDSQGCVSAVGNQERPDQWLGCAHSLGSTHRMPAGLGLRG